MATELWQRSTPKQVELVLDPNGNLKQRELLNYVAPAIEMIWFVGVAFLLSLRATL